jgi:membrane protease YdiL (CAAX protease family)
MFGIVVWKIPFLSRVSGQEPIIFWFLAGGIGVFAPMLFFAIIALHQERAWTSESRITDLQRLWAERLRFRSMKKADWLWAFGGLVCIGIFSAAIRFGLGIIAPDAEMHPAAITISTLTPDRYWLFGLWAPFWIFNIMGEEVLWRGVLLPIQEQYWKNHAWILNALGWTIFHLAFGGALLLTLLPILWILPFIVQRRQNSWIGVVIHAGLNGPGFLAVAFGFVS